MRRLLLIAFLVPVCVGLFPARADAYFWEWIDSLSGPKFKGFTVEWRVWCGADDNLTPAQLQSDLARLDEIYLREIRQAPNSKAKSYFELAEFWIREAKQHLENSRSAQNGARNTEWVLALNARTMAMRDARSATDWTAPNPPPMPAPGAQPPAQPETTGGREQKFRALALAASACQLKPFIRTKQAVAVNVEWGHDVKDDHYSEKITLPDGTVTAIDNKMVTIGGNYLYSPMPWLSAGAGGGVAFFSSNRAPAFQKFYLQPYIIDVRPMAISRRNALSAWWRHTVFIRYNTVVYPTGFEAKRFRDADPEFPAELVHRVGVYVDLEPLVRGVTNKW